MTDPTKFGYAKYKIGSSGSAAIAGAEAAPVVDDNDRSGWMFEKALETPTLPRKINWFYGMPTTENVATGHLSCQWAILYIDHYDGTVDGLPWLTLYTKYDATRPDNASWYRSKLNYQIPIARETVIPGERVCMWTGDHEPPAEYLDGARLIHLEGKRTGPVILDTDIVHFLNIQTDSMANQSKFTVEQLAYQLRTDKPDGRQYIVHLV